MEKLFNLKFLLGLIAFILMLALSASCSDSNFAGAVKKAGSEQNSGDDDDDDSGYGDDDDDDDDDDSLITGNDDTLGLLEDLVIKSHSFDHDDGFLQIHIALDNGPEGSDKEVTISMPLTGRTVNVSGMCNKHKVSQVIVLVSSKDFSRTHAMQAPYFKRTSFYSVPVGQVELTADANKCGFIGTCLDKGEDHTFSVSCPSDDVEVVGM